MFLCLSSGWARFCVLALIVAAAIGLPAGRALAQTGSCCVGTTCTVRTLEVCSSVGGVYGGGTCSPNPCPHHTINIPPVVIAALYHQTTTVASPPSSGIADVVGFPSGPGVYSGPGFSATIGTGDTIVMRFEAPPGKEFNLRRPAEATSVGFSINAYWQAGSDSTSSFATPSVTFENLRGFAAPTSTATTNCYLSNAGNVVGFLRDFTVGVPCSFTAVRVAFTFPNTVPSMMRDYGAVRSSTTTFSFGASAAFATLTPPAQAILSIDDIVSGACCQGTTCTLAPPASCPGVYVGNGSVCSPMVRGGTVNACCPADFDGGSGLQVADIFAFLNAWFAGCP